MKNIYIIVCTETGANVCRVYVCCAHVMIEAGKKNWCCCCCCLKACDQLKQIVMILGAHVQTHTHTNRAVYTEACIYVLPLMRWLWKGKGAKMAKNNTTKRSVFGLS